MWCKKCKKEIFNEKCDVCGTKALDKAPFEVYWCDSCNVPIIKQANDIAKEVCPVCGEKTHYLSSDLRPVFSEERLLVEILFDLPLKFINSSVWAFNNRYFIDGKVKVLPTKKFLESDVSKVIESLEKYKPQNNYDSFNLNIKNL